MYGNLKRCGSEVLYLCLEDSFARIQSRLFEITDEAPPTLHFAIMSAAIGNGLEHQIGSFITEHPDTDLIVIDTLQKVRKTVSANVNPYATDYDDINVLKQIADSHHLAILGTCLLRRLQKAFGVASCPHHGRKQKQFRLLHLQAIWQGNLLRPLHPGKPVCGGNFGRPKACDPLCKTGRSAVCGVYQPQKQCRYEERNHFVAERAGGYAQKGFGAYRTFQTAL